MKDCNVHALTYPKLSDEEKAFLKEYWKENMGPLLSPQIVDTHHPFPHLQNKASYVATFLEFEGVKKFGIVPLPPSLPEIVYLPGEGTRFIKTEDILLKFVGKVFVKHQVIEKTILYIFDISALPAPATCGGERRYFHDPANHGRGRFTLLPL